LIFFLKADQLDREKHDSVVDETFDRIEKGKVFVGVELTKELKD
jgi:hypothetical protein